MAGPRSMRQRGRSREDGKVGRIETAEEGGTRGGVSTRCCSSGFGRAVFKHRLPVREKIFFGNLNWVGFGFGELGGRPRCQNIIQRKRTIASSSSSSLSKRP